MPFQAPAQAPGTQQRPGQARPGGGGGGPASSLDYATGQRFLSPDGGRAGTSPAQASLLQVGSVGPAVTTLQTQLTRLGYRPGPVDGEFGPLTKSAVVRLQQAKGLPADGIVGPQTRGVIDAAVAAAPTPAGPAQTPAAPTPRPGGEPGNGQAAATRPRPKIKPPQVSAGATGPAVVLLQKELKERGFDPGGVDGSFGPATSAAVRAFQRANQLDVDGVVGGSTWEALGYQLGGDSRDVNAGDRGAHTQPGGGRRDGPPPPVPGRDDPDLRERIMAHARGELGRKEAGWNGGDAKKYQEYFGRGREPWCADFVSWVYTQAGLPMNNPYVPSIVAQLKKAGRWRTSSPRPGDMVIFDWDGDGVGDHIGIVAEALPNGRVRTIEGNTGDPAGRGPEGVYERSRVRSTILGYGDATG